MTEFVKFPKMARLSRGMCVTEKIDGTNAQICITDENEFLVGSKTRWIVPGDDNYGFAKWAHEHKDELMELGPGSHFGEWWGQGIQRKYGMQEKKFSLFNSGRWSDPATRPACCDVVPVLYTGPFDNRKVDEVLLDLRVTGSMASPGFMKPEGIVVFHAASRTSFKKTLERDGMPKSVAAMLGDT